MIEINETTLGVWRIQLTPDSDWCMGINRAPDGHWDVSYRFRYYKDDRTDALSKDEKHWFGGTLDAKYSREDVLTKIRSIYAAMIHVSRATSYAEYIGTQDEIMEAMKRDPSMHFSAPAANA